MVRSYNKREEGKGRKTRQKPDGMVQGMRIRVSLRKLKREE